jgi:D-sedoheptulose 7-phosphate isomerase
MSTDPVSIINEIFAAHIEDISSTAVALAEPLSEATEVLVHGLLSDKKILCAGGGSNNALAQIFASHLVNHFTRERPGLPAIALSADSCLLNAVSETSQYAETLARQISTLGNPGDILFLFAGSSNGDSLIRAMRAAHDRELSVVLCHGDNQADVVSLLSSQDVELGVPARSAPHLMEAYLVIINCLCELIDQFLFGGE